jgi:hypothetical protein
MAEQSTELFAYSSDKFVDRDDEIGLVMEKARPLRQGKALDKRTVTFVGERGAGKSWLLACLHDRLKDESIVVHSLNLADYAGRDPILAIIDILHKFGHAVLRQPQASNITPVEISRELMHTARRVLEKQPLALLVDSVYEADWKLLAVMEEYLLGPLAVEEHVLVILAGRGRPYPWKTPELRLKAEFVDVGPFDEAKTIEQLRQQTPEAVSKGSQIYEISGGNPLANSLLAIRENPPGALDEVIGGILETIPPDRRQAVREYLDALCVLRTFDDERILAMLTAYDSSYRDWTYAKAREVRQELVKWALAHWDETQGGYLMDESTRALIERCLKTTMIERWKTMQCAAYWLYRRWVQDYPRSARHWQQEADHHAAQLSKAGFSPEDCLLPENQSPIHVSAAASLPA